jgi:hypothetical protein
MRIAQLNGFKTLRVNITIMSIHACLVCCGPVLQVAKKVLDLKAEGNKMFAGKEWSKAIEQYEAAMKMLPAGHAERSDLLCNKAACLMGLNK